MSEQNLELAQRANLLLNAGDWDALLEMYDPDVEIRDLQHAPDLPEVLHGLDGARTFAAQWVDAYEEFGADVAEYIDVDPWVVSATRWYGRGKGSDVPVEFRSGDALEFKNGKIVNVVVGYPDIAAALEAVGGRRR